MSRFDPYEHLSVVVNPDGSLCRSLKLPTARAKPEPAPGELVASKDVSLNEETKTWIRIFRPTKLPSNDGVVARLPIIIYFHHGGWILLGADDASCHHHCEELTSQVLAITVSVNYCLAPESRLPCQYHDAVDALKWVRKQMLDPQGEMWLRDYADFTRCYLYGCGCGGNIAFFTALKLPDLEVELAPLRVAGIIMNQPMFSGVKRTPSELRFAADEILPLPVLDLMWDLALPKGTDRDHRYCNPMVPGPHHELIPRLGRCLVIGFCQDPMIDRQQEFVKMLTMCGTQVQAWFAEVGFHNVDLVDPRCSAALIRGLKEFIN